jgi:anti-sigma28 factor (negative regulator of flagellin synthesis)
MAKIYQGSIDYAEHSAYLFNDSSLEKVSKLMQSGIEYYREWNIREAKIEALCDKCMNEGVYKVHKNKLVSKLVKCDCKKQYANEIIEVHF